VRGRLERSFIPAGPLSRNRAAHLRAVTVETMNILAAADGGEPSSTIKPSKPQMSSRRGCSVSVGQQDFLRVKR
jgi:hypothetical protein